MIVGGKGARFRGKAVDVVREQVASNVAVDQRIPEEGIGMTNEPERSASPKRERRRDNRPALP